jgi:hypothetical protein
MRVIPAGVMQVVAVLMNGWNISLGQSLNLTSSSSRTLMAEGFMTANGVTHPGSTLMCRWHTNVGPVSRTLMAEGFITANGVTDPGSS